MPRILPGRIMERHESAVPEHIVWIGPRGIHFRRERQRPWRDPRGWRDLGEMNLGARPGALQAGERLKKLGGHGFVHFSRLGGGPTGSSVPRR